MTINPDYNVDSLDVNKDVDDEGTSTVHLYNAAVGKTPRTGGPYLDDVEREEAEKRRAKIEDREPDLDNPPATAGTLLVPKSALVERDVDKSHMSDSVEVTVDPVDSYEVPVEKAEPDPTQVDFDNDMTKLNVLAAGKQLEELSSNQPKSSVASSESDDV